MRPADLPTLAPERPTHARPDLPAAVDDALAVLPPADRRNLTVLVNDPQRHTDSRSVLAELLQRGDVAVRRILIACGTHRFNPDERAAFERSVAQPPSAEETPKGLATTAGGPPGRILHAGLKSKHPFCDSSYE